MSRMRPVQPVKLVCVPPALLLLAAAWPTSLAAQSFGEGERWHGWFCVGQEVCATGDVNGDGRDDIVTFVRDTRDGDRRGDVYVARSSGLGFADSEKWHDWFCIGEEVCALGDVNGDGRDDLLTFLRDSKPGDARGDVYLALSTGRGFAASSRVHDWFCIGRETCAVGDVNGDGKADLITFVGSTKTGDAAGDVWVALSNGRGFAASQRWHGWFCIGGEACVVGDFTGDGRADIATFVKSTKSGDPAGDVYVAASTGRAFEPTPAAKWHGWFCTGQEVCAAGDFNGDGRQDIATFVRDSKGGDPRGDVYVATSTGRAFEPSPGTKAHGWFCVGDELCGTGDFDGDGRDDLIAFVRDARTGDRRGDVYVALADTATGPPPAPPAPPSGGAAFGFGTLHGNGAAALGRRPLLVVIVDGVDSQEMSPYRRNASYFDRLVFGPGWPNVADYFTANSGGAFTWTRAGVIGPIAHDRAGESLSSRYQSIKTDAEAAGFDFSRFDRNSDGRVMPDELSILMIDNYSDAFAQTHSSADCRRLNNSALAVCSTVSAVGHKSQFDQFVHELAHQLGGEDTYGIRCHSDRIGLMGSCTAGAATERALTYHLGPWYKARFGWMEPRVYRIGEGAACSTLQAADGRTQEGSPILLYDPGRGTSEFYLMEYRAPDPSAPVPSSVLSASGSWGYDAHALDQGLAAWYVQTNPSLTLTRVLSRITWGRDSTLQSTPPPGSDDAVRTNSAVGRPDAVFSGPDGILQTARRGDDVTADDALHFISTDPARSRKPRRLLDASDGEIQPVWFDGSPTGLRIRVGPQTPTSRSVQVEWTTGGPFSPRIEAMRSASSGAPGSLVVLDGVFGVAGAGRPAGLVAVKGSGRRDLEIVTWTCNRVTLRVPAKTTPGSYRILVYADESRTRASNAVTYTVTAP